MMTRTYPDAIDTRIVFRIYAIAAWVCGFALLAWGPHWYGTGAPCTPYGLAVPIRIASGAIMGAGCLARAMVNVEDPEARHKALLWFAWGHAIVLAVVFIQLVGVWGDPGALGQVVMGALVATILILLYFWQTADLHRAGEWLAFTNLFKRPQDRPSIDQLRSEYEQHIRTVASQEERNRLARDLHDSIKQQIFIIQTAAATAQARFGADEAGAQEAIAQVRASAREAMIEMEVMLDQLRATPLENVGLVEALKKQCETLGFRTGTRVRFTASDLPPSDAFPPGAQQTVFRVAQEALANVARHARASSVEMTLGTTDTGALQLKVTDDGAGFDAERPAAGMGLANMQARAADIGGAVTVMSQPGNTSVVLSIPAGVRQSDWGNYRRRALLWAALVMMFLVLVVSDLSLEWRRGYLVADAPLLAFNLVVFVRTIVAYRRVRTRSSAALWEESTSHS